MNVEVKYKDDLNRTLFKQSPMRQALKRFEEMNRTSKIVNLNEYTDENMKIKDFISRNQEQAQKNQTAV